MKLEFWIARDECGEVYIYSEEPYREDDDIHGSYVWNSDGHFMELPKNFMPDLTWDDDPIKVYLDESGKFSFIND